MITVRGLDDETKRLLQVRAARNGRSMESEARAILADAVRLSEERPNLLDSFRQHFGDAPEEMPVIPDRHEFQRPIEL